MRGTGNEIYLPVPMILNWNEININPIKSLYESNRCERRERERYTLTKTQTSVGIENARPYKLQQFVNVNGFNRNK